MNLVLASTSEFRREQLARLQIPFRCQAPEVCEHHRDGESAQDRAIRLAVEKARAVAEPIDAQTLVIGSDQVAVLGQRVLDKPGDTERAVEQLLACSGQRVSFFTGVALVEAAGGAQWSHLDRTEVLFRSLDEDEIRRYVDRDQPLSCAGSFKSEALGISLFQAVETRDPSALIGLPLIGLCELLRRAGVTLP